MEGHHGVLRIYKSLAPLEEMSCVTCCSLSPKHYAVLEVKMGSGGPDELAGKCEITSDEKKGWHCEFWAISQPVAWSKCLITEVLIDF